MKSMLTTLALIVCTAPAIALADGRTDYKAFCAGCHGANARVQTEKAKALKMDVRKLALRASKKTRAEMIEIVEKGKGDMPSFTQQLSKEQISAVIDYVIGLRKK